MPQTIGQRLKKEREARYLSLEKVSADTRIRKFFLQALESDDYSVMPSAAQGRGFLRNYANYLGLNVDEMIAEIQRNAPPPGEVIGPLPEVNLVETEIPPLVVEEESPPPFWMRWLRRRPIAESSAAAESVKPAEAENLPEEEEQAEGREEAQAGFFKRLASFFQFKIVKREVESVTEIEEVETKEEPPPPPSLPADAIFAEIGAQLRERRETISLTIAEVERHTRLRAAFIKALEEGSFEKLPSPVQTRGMLANYAAFLDLDTDAILLRFADALQARRREKYAETPRERIQMQVGASISPLRTFITSDLIFGAAMIVLLIALVTWGMGRALRLQAERNAAAQVTAPSIADVIANFATPTPAQQAALPIEAATEAPAGEAAFPTPVLPLPGGSANVVVSVFAVERAFVRISVDGRVAFEGRMLPRETKVFEADDQVSILTGNAAALRVTYNGRDLGLMGGVGEVVIRVYLEDGVATPTATLPPTPTNTPPVTPTVTPSRTPTPTPPENS